MDGDPAVLARQRDHRVVLDVQLLLVADAVGRLDDHQAVLGQRGVDVALEQLVVGEDRRGLERLEHGVHRRRPRGDPALRLAQRVAIGGGEQGDRLGLVADLAAQRDEDRLVLGDAGDDVPARDVVRGDDGDAGPVEGGVELDRQQPGMRHGRADRRAIPGAREHEVVRVQRLSGELGRAFAAGRDRDGETRHRRGRRDARGWIVNWWPPPSRSPQRAVGRRGGQRHRGHGQRAGGRLAAEDHVRPAAEGSTGRRAGVLAVVDHDRPVHDDVGDPDRELARLVVGRGRADRGRVEQHDVRRAAVGEQPRSRSPRRAAGIPVMRWTASSSPSSRSSRTNWPRIRGYEPYVRGRGLVRDQHAVGPDHRLRVAEERPDPVRVRPRRHLVHPEVLGEQEVADRVDRVASRLAHDVAQRPALPGEVLRPGEGAEAQRVPRAIPGEQAAAGLHLGADPLAGGAVGEARLQRHRRRPPGSTSAA